MTRIPKNLRLATIILSLLVGIIWFGNYTIVERVALRPFSEVNSGPKFALIARPEISTEISQTSNVNQDQSNTAKTHSKTVDNVDKTEQGNPLSFKQQRIIALAPHVVEMLFDIGVGERIVATTEHSDFPRQANDIPRIGNYSRLKIEQIITYKPDLIIAWRTGNPSDDLARLKQLGFNIVYSDPKLLKDIAKEFRWFGKLTGHEVEAEQKALKFEQDLDILIKKYQNQPSISVFYELWSKPLTTIARKAWPQQHLEVCGAINPFVDLATEYPQINLEQIVIANPQLIIQPISKGVSNQETIDWQKFEQIKAVRNNQFLTPNSDILHRMSYRLLTELNHLCEGIHASRRFYQDTNN